MHHHTSFSPAAYHCKPVVPNCKVHLLLISRFVVRLGDRLQRAISKALSSRSANSSAKTPNICVHILYIFALICINRAPALQLKHFGLRSIYFGGFPLVHLGYLSRHLLLPSDSRDFSLHPIHQLFTLLGRSLHMPFARTQRCQFVRGALRRANRASLLGLQDGIEPSLGLP